MLFNSWFSPSGYKVLSFKTQKFSLLFKSVLVSSVVVCFLICSIKVNSACCWKLWFCLLKCLHAKIEACDLASFLWLLRRMLEGVSLFNAVKLTYMALEQINQVFTFASKAVKYLKGFFCPVTLENFCLLQLFTTKIVNSWEVWWTMPWSFWYFCVSTYNFVFKDPIASD